MRRFMAVLILAIIVNLMLPIYSWAAENYCVQPGDTLFLIGQRFGVSSEQIQKENNMGWNTMIYPGENLVIPTGSSSSSSSSSSYIVKAGDTLFLIGQRFGIDHNEIMWANGLSDGLIYPGQALNIPNRGGGSSTNTNVSNTSIPSRGSLSWRDIELLTKVVNGEARGEPYIGQVAVAAVVLNRVKSKLFPNTVPGVIYQPWAFTALHDGQINAPLTASARDAVHAALNGWAPTGGALYYWNPVTATSSWVWTRTIITKIGSHVFAK